MAQLLVPDLDEGVVARLRLRAQSRGKSLEAHVRDILAEAAVVSRAEIAAKLAELRARQKPHKTCAADLIREDRDR